MSAYTRGRRPSRSPASPARNSALSWFRSHTATSSIFARALAARCAMPRRWRRPIPPQPIKAMGMRSGTKSGSCGDEPAPIGERARGDVEECFVPAEEAFQLVDHETEEARSAGRGDTGDVRTEKHVRQIANRTPRWNGLRIEYVNRHADIA